MAKKGGSCKTSDHCGCLVSFPLTPALSLGERESRIQSLGKAECFDLAAGLEAILRLNGGEGRDEGK